MGPHHAALIGKAGEAAVASELMRRHIDVAYPAHDAGVDLIAYLEYSLTKFVPVQVKARSSSCYQFNRDWFRIDGLVLVQVWNMLQVPEFYIFNGLEDVEDALGEIHCATESWRMKGAYTSTSPTKKEVERMQRYRNRWDKIEDALKTRAGLETRLERFTYQTDDLEVVKPAGHLATHKPT